jgi:hypothetical protein
MWGEVIGMGLLAGGLVWLLRGRTAAATIPAKSTDLTYEEMEAAEELRQAEEEVTERESSAQPEDEEPGDDWGPGTPRARA